MRTFEIGDIVYNKETVYFGGGPILEGSVWNVVSVMKRYITIEHGPYAITLKKDDRSIQTEKESQYLKTVNK